MIASLALRHSLNLRYLRLMSIVLSVHSGVHRAVGMLGLLWLRLLLHCNLSSSARSTCSAWLTMCVLARLRVRGRRGRGARIRSVVLSIGLRLRLRLLLVRCRAAAILCVLVLRLRALSMWLLVRVLQPLHYLLVQALDATELHLHHLLQVHPTLVRVHYVGRHL